MSCLHIPIPKKLKQLPSSSKKAWKSFTSSVPHKLRHLRNHLQIPTSVTATARRLLNLRPKRHPRTGRTHGSLSYNYYKRQQYYQYQHFQQSSSVPPSPATVYVDRLFGESSKTQTMGPASTSAGDHDTAGSNENHENEDAVETEQRRRKKVGNNIERRNARWKEYISSLPTIRGVDERAEEFISKFKQQMQLQREQSSLEFQQMLARSA